MNCVTSISMLTHSKSKKTEIVISKGNTPKESLIHGIEQLGGISKFINKGDQVFIKFNLNLPGGFPTNTNLDVLESLISSCKEAGAEKVYIGSFPPRGIPIKSISDFLNLKEHFERLEAELIFLDNSDFFEKKEISQEKLKKVKYDSLTWVEINGNEFLVPNVILNSNKFISINQVNVNPLFQLNLSLLNFYSIIPPKYRKISTKTKENLPNDQYKKQLISNILDVLSIKQPNLIINDLFYILEGAGPYLYKDSKIRKTNLMVIGNNAIAVDIITLNILNLEINNSEIVAQAQLRHTAAPILSDIKVLGEKIEDIRTQVELCVSELKDIKVRNVSINSGKICSGCFKYAYHLLNVMKTYMGKDLKYNVNNSFLIGENPPEPKEANNYIIFGDCAIHSTKSFKFRKIIIKPNKHIIGDVKSKILKKQKSKKSIKFKEKQNKNILELPGCPPIIFNCLESFLKYYGKKNLPNLDLLLNTNRFWLNGHLNDKLKLWEAL
ncbi:MAG: DUF362 domain-containing protein [Promethearchaeota archaeon]